ncbi:MAG TPA: hypothetical protein VET23_10480 [Chitinophagaceae bacterium]|nr:hypothetical protein [Chitinophagaceae bacterium]
MITTEYVFDKRPGQLKKLYDKIVTEVQKLGEYREETMPPDVI